VELFGAPTMTESNNDELADALAKFADGDVAPSEEQTFEPAEDVEPVEQPATEDDEVIPEVEMEALSTPIVNWSSATEHHRIPLYQTMQFRQTIIPILLTCGMLTLVLASLKTLLGADSLFSDLPGWVPVALFIAGVVLLFLAIINMFAVKEQLIASKK
jgi:hypothetical protein